MSEKSSKLDRYLNGYVLFVSVLLFSLIWIFQGFDVTDSGWHLSNQMGASSFSDRPTSGFVALFFLSDFVGGMWLRIINTPNILWARLGGLLLSVFNALISYKILSVYFDKKKVFFVVFASTLFLAGSSTLIHYFTFPALLINLGLLFFNQLLNRPIESISFKVYSFLLGFIVIPIILARFTLIPILFIPVILLLYYLISRKEMVELKKSAPYVIAGVFISTLLFALFYASIDFLRIYIESIKNQVFTSATGNAERIVRGHGMFQLLKQYSDEFRYHVISITVMALFCLYIVSLLKGRLSDRTINLIFLILTVVGTMLFLLVYDASFYSRSLKYLSIGLILIVSVMFFTHDKGESKNLSLLLLIAVFAMVISPIGSNGGLAKSKNGMWVSLPLIFLITYELKGKMDNKRLRAMFSLNTVFISLIILASVFIRFSSVYRDSNNRFKLNTEFKYKYLHNLYSQKKRVEVVDEALMKIDELTQKDDVVLMINEIPMFYYLTQTKPFFGESWLFFYHLEMIKSMYEKAIEKGRYPRLFVYSKTNTSRSDWPTDEIADESELPVFDYFVGKYVNELHYNLIWENSAFAVYSRPQYYDELEGS